MNLTVDSRPKQAGEYIESLGIIITHGKVYNIYQCGCVILNDEDPQCFNHFHQVRLRCCPEHNDHRLLNKFKRCSCGREYFSKRIQASKQCGKCYGVSPETKEAKRQWRIEYEKYGAENARFRNKRQADPARWDCRSRDKCLIEYIKYDAIPCKGCKEYRPKPIEADAYMANGPGFDQKANHNFF